MCSENEKEERIDMFATLFYWNCFEDVAKVLDWCQIKGFFNTDDCKKVIERRDYINHIEDEANNKWQDVDTQFNYNLKRFCNGC